VSLSLLLAAVWDRAVSRPQRAKGLPAIQEQPLACAAPAEPSGIAVARGPLKSSRTAHARVSNPAPARPSAVAPAGERQKIAIVRGGPYLPGMARAGRLPFGPRIIHLGAEAR